MGKDNKSPPPHTRQERQTKSELKGYFAVALLVAVMMTLINTYEIPQRVKSTVTALFSAAVPQDVWAGNDGIFDQALFDDDKFVRQYRCDANHSYRMQFLSRKSQLMYIHDLITAGEAQHLISISRPLMQRSMVVGEEDYVHESRTSQNAFLDRRHDPVVSCIEDRVSYLTKHPVKNIEPLQVVWYREGQEYQPHFDYFDPQTAGADRELLRGGQRQITIFVYLNTVNADVHGGETVFPELNIKVPARRGDAAFWFDTDEHDVADILTLHGGAPIRGNFEKTGLNIWIREGEFN